MLPAMRSRRRLCAWALVACIGAMATSVGAPRAAWADETSPANVAAARRHFERARAYYAQGSYREAIGELEAAHTLDPNAKDLVFNLGVVHEKLGDIDDALKYFHRYEQMDLTDQERAKADAYLKRLEGARHEVEKPPEPAPPPQPPPPQPPPPPPPPEHGRVDALTITAAGLAVVGFGVGTYFGLRALSERPKAGSITSSEDTYADLQTQANKSHNAAIVADVSFATGIVATGLAAYLYFGRTRPSGDGGKTGDSPGQVVLYGTAVPGGGALVLGGRF
jgi:tetratricopeptide (TPR) repeat protein